MYWCGCRKATPHDSIDALNRNMKFVEDHLQAAKQIQKKAWSVIEETDVVNRTRMRVFLHGPLKK